MHASMGVSTDSHLAILHGASASDAQLLGTHAWMKSSGSKQIRYVFASVRSPQLALAKIDWQLQRVIRTGRTGHWLKYVP